MSGQLPRKSSLRDEKSRNSPTMHNVPRKMSMFDERGMLITQPPEDRPRRLSLLRPLRRNSEVDGHGVETGPGLDEEMEKVFAMGEEDRFDVARFATSPDSNTSKRSFNEKDYSFHRKKSYPHMHAPLKSLYSRSIRRKEVPSPRVSESESIEGGASIEANESRKLSQTGTDSDTGWSSPPMPLHPTINEDNSTRY